MHKDSTYKLYENVGLLVTERFTRGCFKSDLKEMSCIYFNNNKKFRKQTSMQYSDD